MVLDIYMPEAKVFNAYDYIIRKAPNLKDKVQHLTGCGAEVIQEIKSRHNPEYLLKTLPESNFWIR